MTPTSQEKRMLQLLTVITRLVSIVEECSLIRIIRLYLTVYKVVIGYRLEWIPCLNTINTLVKEK